MDQWSNRVKLKTETFTFTLRSEIRGWPKWPKIHPDYLILQATCPSWATDVWIVDGLQKGRDAFGKVS
eukprot:5086725-Pyramimonas_sp.AAC.2